VLQAGLTTLLVVAGGDNSTAYSGKRLFLKLNKLSPQPNSASSSKCNSYLRQLSYWDRTPVLEILKQPYKTYALSQAQPNTVIQLAPGNYTSETGKSSHWLSNKALRFVGMNPPKARTR